MKQNKSIGYSDNKKNGYYKPRSIGKSLDDQRVILRQATKDFRAFLKKVYTKKNISKRSTYEAVAIKSLFKFDTTYSPIYVIFEQGILNEDPFQDIADKMISEVIDRIDDKE